jgi:hypothetical protein
MKYIIKTFFLIFIPINLCFASFSLKESLQKGSKGDFIVTFQNNVYSLLLIQEITNKKITLFEISVPKKHVTKKDFSWKNQILKKSINSTSFNSYEIDISSGKLLTCFSFLKNSFFKIEDQNNFLTKFLTLPLTPVSNDKRKKIGPLMNDEVDTRAFFSPPMIINGKKQKKPQYKVYQTVWPKDGSDLSGKTLDLYFDDKSTFPFPFWVQISTGNIEVMLKAVDSGKNLICNTKIPN